MGSHLQTVRRIVRAYDVPIVKAYCWCRFGILRQRFLEEIGRYLPAAGRILDIGCGFGLFSLYYAASAQGRTVFGIDINTARIDAARRAAARLGLSNASYDVADARSLDSRPGWAAIYMMDIVHHLDTAEVPALLRRLHADLAAGGWLLIKDVDAEPAWKRRFTRVLDFLLSPSAPVSYWHADELAALLEESGFRVRWRALVDVLPYPHVLFICQRGSAPANGVG